MRVNECGTPVYDVDDFLDLIEKDPKFESMFNEIIGYILDKETSK
jgi:hypothetical protein